PHHPDQTRGSDRCGRTRSSPCHPHRDGLRLAARDHRQTRMTVVTAATAEAVASGDVLENVTIRLSDGDSLQLARGMTLRDATIESQRPIALHAFSFAGVLLERVRFRNISFAYGSFDGST